MGLYGWVLVALSGAGLLGAIAGLALGLAGVLRLQRRVAALGQSSFVTKIESLQIQAERLSRISADAEELRTRTQAAIETIRKAPEIAGVSELRNAWLQCATQIRAIAQELS